MLKSLVTSMLVLLMVMVESSGVLARFDSHEQPSIFAFAPAPVSEYVPEPCEQGSKELCFGDYYKVLPKSAYINKTVVPDTIVIHTDDQPGGTPEKWVSTTTWNGLAGRDNGGRSTHFGVGLDGVGQFLPMYEGSVIQCRGAGYKYDKHSVQIEMAGRNYNYMLTGKASPTMVRSIEIITAQTVELVIVLMETYDISIENVIGHYEVEGSGKTDPGNIYFEQYFLPLLKAELNQ
ncbi:hypothetical protein A2274_01570 [candidate division WWE3 bacterium RIFOXYA12_FULL_43_11]|nr:MAG: hypothetical protein A2274_01570 [candidate division WWE3 bacterium RIFOXYA12_FULL_43_11]